ncbi:MAG: hypothetical protein LBG81_02635 [Coriobacteriaceae bacterium]|jgi:hypothetical protein|nr:hypothetical protein [Coriobacteriaceae bacterium]
MSSNQAQGQGQTGGLPQFLLKPAGAYKPVSAGMTIAILVIVTLVSWAIIGGVVMYALDNDVIGKAQNTVEATIGKARG